jgi:hypothetical protein
MNPRLRRISFLIVPQCVIERKERFMPRFVLLLAPCLTLVISLSASAVPFAGSGSGNSGDVGFHIPTVGADGWARFSENSTYQEWDVFYQPSGGNYVDADRIDTDPVAGSATWAVSNANLYPGLPATFNSYSINSTSGGLAIGGKPASGATASAGTQAGTSRLTQTNAAAGAFITGAGLPGAGNIYSFSAATSFDVDIWNYNLPAAAETTILLQLHVQGSAPDPASIRLINPADSTQTLAPSAAQVLFDDPDFSFGGNQGVNQTLLYRWIVPGNADSYTLRFAASGPSMSLQNVAVDTFTAVPEPASFGVLALLGSAVLLRRRSH